VTDPPDRSVQRCPTRVPKRPMLVCQADDAEIRRSATLNFFFQPRRGSFKLFSAWALGFQTTRESSVVAANSSMSTATYQTKASVPATGRRIPMRHSYNRFAQAYFRIVKAAATRINAVGSTSSANAGPNSSITSAIWRWQIVCTLKMGRIVCTQTDKNARRQAPANYPTKQPISTKGSGRAVGNRAHKLRWISFRLLVAQ